MLAGARRHGRSDPGRDHEKKLMLTIDLAGSSYEMGRQHAQQVADARDRIAAALAAFLSDARLNRNQRSEAERFDEYLTVAAPTVWEMYRGVVEGLRFEWDDMVAYALRNYLAPRSKPEGCTVLAEGRNGPDGPLIGKTRDYFKEHASIQLIGFAAPTGALRFVFVGSAGSPGVFGAGMNEAGLAVADNHVPTSDLGLGLPSYALMQGLLEVCRDVDEGIAYLKSVDHMGSTNLTLVDADGHIAVCESAHSGPQVRRTVTGFDVSTNHFIDGDLSRSWAGSPGERENSEARRGRMMVELAGAKVTLDRMMALLSSHGVGGCCRHAPDHGTILAAVFLPALRGLRISAGSPCQDPWTTVETAAFLGGGS
jgi:predicted choloylglycine hydrolase